MRVGTDGVLLGAWARLPERCADGGEPRVLDIGTGTGLIALMMAQRFPHAQVDGIDISDAACRKAAENVAASSFAKRIDIRCEAVQQYCPTLTDGTAKTYDAIVSNPPFFVDSLQNPDEQKALARHAVGLSFEDLARAVDRLLAKGGEFSVIVPADSLQPFMSACWLSGLFVVRDVSVRTVATKPVKRHLLAFRRQPVDEVEKTEVVLQGKGGVRSDWYARLTSDFYIK